MQLHAVALRRARFGASMPGGGDDMFYSFNMGPLHFVSINTEFYYYLNYGVSQVPLAVLCSVLCAVSSALTLYCVQFVLCAVYSE